MKCENNFSNFSFDDMTPGSLSFKFTKIINEYNSLFLDMFNVINCDNVPTINDVKYFFNSSMFESFNNSIMTLESEIIFNYLNMSNVFKKVLGREYYSIDSLKKIKYVLSLALSLIRDNPRYINKFGIYKDTLTSNLNITNYSNVSLLSNWGIVFELRPKSSRSYFYSLKEKDKMFDNSDSYDEVYINELTGFLESNKIKSIVYSKNSINKENFPCLILFKIFKKEFTENVSNSKYGIKLDYHSEVRRCLHNEDEPIDPDFSVPIFMYPITNEDDANESNKPSEDNSNNQEDENLNNESNNIEESNLPNL